MVGYVAVAGLVNPVAVALAMFVVFWTPIHIWSLAIRYREDYARAGVQMMPVVVGVSRSAAYVGYASIALAVWTVIYVVAAGSAFSHQWRCS
jgi:protoheme IX farnesyltransferase